MNTATTRKNIKLTLIGLVCSSISVFAWVCYTMGEYLCIAPDILDCLGSEETCFCD